MHVENDQHCAKAQKEYELGFQCNAQIDYPLDREYTALLWVHVCQRIDFPKLLANQSQPIQL